MISKIFQTRSVTPLPIVFEYVVLDLVKSSGEQPPTLKKMFIGHLWIEHSILLNPYFLALNIILNGNEKVPCKDERFLAN